MQIYAHRGASRTHAENTIGAFAEAVRLGVDGIELDIHATSDGVPVVIHDSSLGRTAGADFEIPDLTLDRLRSIAPTIPTFAEVLDLVGSALHFDIEVKPAGIEEPVLELLGRYPQIRWSISCFDWTVLERFRELDESCDLWLLSSQMSNELVETASRLNATAAALDAPAIKEQTIKIAHDAALKVMAWTVNDVDRARQLEAWGLDMLCTDAPHLFVG
ncbi:MAG TPA: glycerophosphodiester phosphodiesterase [Thermomicrobiales bacterium]|nr:glycerophosphodiester phosphodiesterase [Thermomicrobiales bacterium]